MNGITFTAEAFDSAVLLKWFVGAGSPESTPDDLCEVTIQFSEVELVVAQGRPGTTIRATAAGAPPVIPNTPPYVVRELQQPQMTNNLLYHPGLTNGASYSYTLFVHYMDTGVWGGPVIVSPVTPQLGLSSPLVSGSLSYSKLGVNTKLRSDNTSLAEVVVWLPDAQIDRQAELEAVVHQLKPAHIRAVVVYEPYYIAHTTAAQLAAGTFASGSYEIVDGTLINKVPTIDYSFSGKREILGGS